MQVNPEVVRAAIDGALTIARVNAALTPSAHPFYEETCEKKRVADGVVAKLEEAKQLAEGLQ